MSTTAPALFVTHGAPTLPLEDIAARDFLAAAGDLLDGARAVLVISAHWVAPVASVSAAPRPATIHDFHGFPEALYRLSYPARGDAVVAQTVAGRLRSAGIAATIDPDRGLDHGAWVPLLLMRPTADLPVLQLSTLAGEGPEGHLALGRALQPLRDQGVAVLASGSITHNLGDIDWTPATREHAWARTFADWLADRVAADDREALVDYRARAPHAAHAHPHDDHLMPFYVALGAGGRGERIHASTSHGTLAMDAYSFA
ncbi:MAG: class III extradiol ring-cleavage dioxygenase [Azospirillaceae bacterium]